MLGTQDRQSVWSGLMRSLPGPVEANKLQLLAAVEAADSWVEANLSNFEAVLPAAIGTPGPSQNLLANVVAIGRGSTVSDVSAGIANRSQSASLLAAYNAASSWFSQRVGSYVAVVQVAGEGQLLQTQLLQVLETVCRKRGEVQGG